MTITVYSSIWTDAHGWKVTNEGRGRELNRSKIRVLSAATIADAFGENHEDKLYTVRYQSGKIEEFCA